MPCESSSRESFIREKDLKGGKGREETNLQGQEQWEREKRQTQGGTDRHIHTHLFLQGHLLSSSVQAQSSTILVTNTVVKGCCFKISYIILSISPLKLSLCLICAHPVHCGTRIPMAGLCYYKYLLLFREARIVISVDTTKDSLCSIASFRSSGHCSLSLVAANKQAICVTPPPAQTSGEDPGRAAPQRGRCWAPAHLAR